MLLNGRPPGNHTRLSFLSCIMKYGFWKSYRVVCSLYTPANEKYTEVCSKRILIQKLGETMGYNKRCSIEMRFFISCFIISKRGKGEPQVGGDPPRETGDVFSI